MQCFRNCKISINIPRVLYQSFMCVLRDVTLERQNLDLCPNIISNTETERSSEL